jgi:hypothetical protein
MRLARSSGNVPALVLLLLFSAGCGGSDGLHGSPEDLGDLVFGTGGSIPREKLGVQNEFVANPKGNAPAQGNDIRSTLGLRHIRTSFFFDEGFLPSEGATPNFARFDAIMGSIPPDVDLLPILAYAPQWLANRPDWKDVFLSRYVIIDEAQNLTPKQMKTLITRAGPGTKVVCLGNIAQIDTPYLTEGSSGLTYVVDRFKGWGHSGHVTLMRGDLRGVVGRRQPDGAERGQHRGEVRGHSEIETGQRGWRGVPGSR